MFYWRGGVLWVKFKCGGKLYRESTGTADRARAEIEAARLRLKYNSGKPRTPRGQRATLTQVSAADIARAEGDQVTASQAKTLRYLWSHALAYFGPDSDPADVDFERVEAYVHARRAAGQRGQSITREVQCLKRGLKIAARRGWVDAVPVDWPRIKSDPPDVARAGKWVPVEVIRDWLEAMEPLARLHAAGVGATGLRAEEMLRGSPDWLREPPPGVDAAAVVLVPAEASKNRKPRAIPVDAWTAELLLTYWAFPDRPKSHRRARDTARRAIGYPVKITLRDLRHVCATLAEKRDRKAAQDLLGHTTERMTQRYLHSTPERLAAVTAAVVDGLGIGGRGHKLGGTILDGIEKAGGRRGFRTPDPLRVNPASRSDYSNLRSVSDTTASRNHSRSSDQGAQRGHSAKRRRGRAG